MQSKAWMITYLFKDFLSFFKRLILGGISLTNRHLFILDGHGSHVTLETIEQAKRFALNMIILLSHTLHALQPLNVACFKPFKTIFKGEINTSMFSRNYIEPNNLAQVRWVDKVFTITKCGCSSLIPIHQTSEFTQNPMKSFGVQGHLLL